MGVALGKAVFWRENYTPQAFGFSCDFRRNMFGGDRAE